MTGAYGPYNLGGSATKDVFVVAEEADECAFLFGGKCGTNAYHFALGAPRVYYGRTS